MAILIGGLPQKLPLSNATQLTYSRTLNVHLKSFERYFGLQGGPSNIGVFHKGGPKCKVHIIQRHFFFAQQVPLCASPRLCLDTRRREAPWGPNTCATCQIHRLFPRGNAPLFSRPKQLWGGGPTKSSYNFLLSKKSLAAEFSATDLHDPRFYKILPGVLSHTRGCFRHTQDGWAFFPPEALSDAFLPGRQGNF